MKRTASKPILAITLMFACCAFLQAQPPGGQGSGSWIRNAYYGEAQTFDKCPGHQPDCGMGMHKSTMVAN